MEAAILDSRISGFPEFWVSGFLDFTISGLLDFTNSALLDFWLSGFLDFPIWGFLHSRRLGFPISGFPDCWIAEVIQLIATPLKVTLIPTSLHTGTRCDE